MLNILDWWRGRTSIGRTATEIYGSIVANARNPKFYRDFGVPDVAEARYEMVVLHMAMVLERLRIAPHPQAEGTANPHEELSQALVEAFVRDLDGSIREMAVSDTKVPAKVKKAAGGLRDRDLLYREAFANEAAPAQAANSQTSEASEVGADNPDDLSRAGLLDELIYKGNGGEAVDRLVGYVEAARLELRAWTPMVQASDLTFPDPGPFAAGDA